MKASTILKLCVSGLLVVCAAIPALLRGGAFTLWILAGMALGAHGDVCLAGIPAVNRLYRQPFLVGAASFLLGHVCYITAFRTGARGVSPSFAVLFGASLLYMVAAYLVWALCVRGSRKPPGVRYGALAYGLVLAAMAVCALAFSLRRSGAYALWWTPAVGGVLFMLSDTLIAVKDMKGGRIPAADTWIWLTYAPAQALIVLSAWFY